MKKSLILSLLIISLISLMLFTSVNIPTLAQGSCIEGTNWTKYSGNPLAIEEYGHISTTSVINDGSIYKMWYPYENNIRYATSSDGIEWHIIGDVLPPGPAEWEQLSVGAPSVIYNGTHYLMYYRGYPSHGGQQAYGLAISEDGEEWTKYPSNENSEPVLSPDSGEWDSHQIGGATVLFDGTMYHMWYHAKPSSNRNDIGYANSIDGKNWVKPVNHPVIARDSTGIWSYDWNIMIGGSSVIKEGSTFKMWFGGQDSSDYKWRIGFTTSLDGVNWEEPIPVIYPGPSAWDGDYVFNPTIIRFENNYTMWYCGAAEATRQQVGLAYSDLEPPKIIIDAPANYGIYPSGSDIRYSFYATDNIDPNPIVEANVTDFNGNWFLVNSGDALPIGSGVYTLNVTATDYFGNSATEELTFVIYDPSAGFATGGGWITPELDNEKANFGFVAKYHKGSTIEIPTDEWTDIELVTTESTDVSGAPVDSRVDQEGNVHFVWFETTPYSGSGTDYDIYYRVRFNDGTYGPYELVSKDTNHSNFPVVGIDSIGQVHVVWVDRESYVLYSMRQIDGIWTTQEEIGSCYRYTKPTIDVDSEDNVHVIWDSSSDIWQAEKAPGVDWTTE